MKRVRTARALRDFQDCILWSARNFGKQAAYRYKVLLEVAILDLGENADPIGSDSIEEFNGSVRKYHLRHSRKNAAVGGLIVKKPRHFIVYRVNGDTLEILRVLHDRMDLPLPGFRSPRGTQRW
jgi:toxin ParE1/3/4